MANEKQNTTEKHQAIFEIEKRAAIDNKKQFSELKDKLDKETKFLGEKVLTTYLFKQPKFVRIRINQGNDYFTITEKSGDYSDKARLEKNINRPLKELTDYFAELKKDGFQECAKLRTQRLSYQFNNDIKIELNIIDHLGMIVEVEAMTEDNKKIDELEAMVRETLASLNLNSLSSQDYQGMMDDMYMKAIKPVSDIEIN